MNIKNKRKNIYKSSKYHLFNNNKKDYIYFPEEQQIFYLPSKYISIINSKTHNSKKEDLLAHLCERMSNRKIDNNIDKKYKEIDLRSVKYTLYLLIATTCNMACTYCFAKEGSYGRKESVMDLNTAKEAIKLSIDRFDKNSYGTLIINFFGGEPLIAWNNLKNSCLFAEEYAESKGKRDKIHFTLTTNATLVTQEIANFFKAKKFGVAISIDGSEFVHNKNRKMKDGSGSYFRTLKGINILLSTIDSKMISARATYQDFDYPFYMIYEDLEKIGFASINVIPNILDITDIELKKLLNQLDDLKIYIMEKAKKGEPIKYPYLMGSLFRIFIDKSNNKIRNCGVGGKSVHCITPNGDIYPCHRATENKELKIGDINNKTLNSTILSNEDIPCNNCWNKYLCHHGCAYDNYIKNGSPIKAYKPYCLFSRKLSEIAMSLLYELPNEIIKNIIENY